MRHYLWAYIPGFPVWLWKFDGGHARGIIVLPCTTKEASWDSTQWPYWLDSGVPGGRELGHLCKQERVLHSVYKVCLIRDEIPELIGCYFSWFLHCVRPFTHWRSMAFCASTPPTAVLFEWNEYIIFMACLWKGWASQGINRCCRGSFPSAVHMCERGDGNQGSRCFERNGRSRRGDGEMESVCPGKGGALGRGSAGGGRCGQMDLKARA